MAAPLSDTFQLQKWHSDHRKRVNNSTKQTHASGAFNTNSRKHIVLPSPSQTDVGETANAHLHRGLRQPALLLALLEVVRDNGMGSAVQRAAGSALVAFCDVRIQPRAPPRRIERSTQL